MEDSPNASSRGKGLRTICARGVALLSLVSVSVVAVPAARAEPASELDQLDYFLGTWQCEGWDAASVLGPEHRTRTRLVFTRDLDGLWLVMHWEETVTAENPRPWKLENAFTYNAPARAFVFMSRDNTGFIGTGTSLGWQGATLVVSGTSSSGGDTAEFRDTYIRRGRDAFHFVTEYGSNGALAKDAELTCERLPRQ